MCFLMEMEVDFGGLAFGFWWLISFEKSMELVEA